MRFVAQGNSLVHLILCSGVMVSSQGLEVVGVALLWVLLRVKPRDPLGHDGKWCLLRRLNPVPVVWLRFGNQSQRRVMTGEVGKFVK